MLIEKLIKLDQQDEEFINHYPELGFSNPDEMRQITSCSRGRVKTSLFVH